MKPDREQRQLIAETWLTARQAAAAVNVSIEEFDRLPNFPEPVRIGGERYWQPDTLVDWLEQRDLDIAEREQAAARRNDEAKIRGIFSEHLSRRHSDLLTALRQRATELHSIADEIEQGRYATRQVFDAVVELHSFRRIDREEGRAALAARRRAIAREVGFWMRRAGHSKHDAAERMAPCFGRSAKTVKRWCGWK